MWRRAVALGDLEAAALPFSVALTLAGHPVDRATAQGAPPGLLLAAAKAMAEAAEERVRRTRGDWDPADAAVEAAASPKLEALLEAYQAERKLPAKTLSEWRTAVRRFREVCGDLPWPRSAASTSAS